MGTSVDEDVDTLKAEKQSLQDQVVKMEHQLSTKETKLGQKDGQIVARDREIANLKSDLQKMTVRANQAERKFLDLQGKQKVRLCYVYIHTYIIIDTTLLMKSTKATCIYLCLLMSDSIS